MNKIYRVYDGGEVCWIIADDPEKARTISRSYLREEGWEESDFSPEVITVMSDEDVLTVTDDGRGIKQSRTVREWIDSEPEGFLCTTCF